ncbi:dihydropteroate synthase [Candidatus Melainabacteria bacterium MEL.A1]|nr:dihydropteroate synthase [Candidatus Melainabacteria bacterium MEL.A1]
MHDFILREIKDTDIEKEINAIGFDKSYSHKAKEKFEYKNIKIYSLTPAMANILKQTALSVGCDCATHREVITGKIENSNCILGGSVSQIKKIAEKLKFQPFGLKELGKKLENSCPPLTGGPKSMISRRGTKLVGILNLTTNSFSDGGMYNDFEKAKEHLLELISDGADIIDIGAESTKPYSSPVSPKEQLEKLLPIIDFAKNKTTISIDTRSAIVAEECINAGANIINDVSGFDYDEKMIDVIAKHNIPIIIQHSQGTPETMQNSPHYNNLIEDIFLNLKKKIDFAHSKNIKNIIIDPGIGFGKTKEDNFEIIKRIEEFQSLNCPIMLGISRKSLLDMPNADNLAKDIYTTAINALAIERNVDYIRVHNIKMHRKLIDLMDMFVIK